MAAEHHRSFILSTLVYKPAGSGSRPGSTHGLLLKLQVLWSLSYGSLAPHKWEKKFCCWPVWAMYMYMQPYMQESLHWLCTCTRLYVHVHVHVTLAQLQCHVHSHKCTYTHSDTGSISSEVQGHPSDQPALVHQYPTHRHHAIHEAKAPRQSKP